MTKHVRFVYQYRDGSNYKSCDDLLYNNPSNREVDEIEDMIRASLIDSVWFVAHQIEIPELFLFNDGKTTN